jgi:hypothetical protein
MHKSAISIWKTSLRLVTGLPECPQGMSEPAWVNLAFSPYCHVRAIYLSTKLSFVDLRVLELR